MTCARGASALQDLLAENADVRLHVFVVWERVIPTDIAEPTNGKLAVVRDARVEQYWDPTRAISKDIVRAVLASPPRYPLSQDIDATTIVWDMIAVFPKGVRWEADIPVPLYHGEPVVRAIPELRRTLAAMVEN